MWVINYSVRLMLPILFLSLCFPTVVHIPADYSTIQRGIDASVDSDTILVEIGTYYENINFNGKNIILLSHFCYDESPDSAFLTSTIIDGNNSGSVVTFDSGESI